MKIMRRLIPLLLIAAALFTLCACRSNQESGTETLPGLAAVTASVPQTTPEPEPEATARPLFTPWPEPTSGRIDMPTAVPTEKPTDGPTAEPTPTPLLGPSYEGEFSSDTGTALNLIVKWTAVRESDGNYSVNFGIHLQCYSLFVSKRTDNTLTVSTSGGTKEYKFTTDAIDRDATKLGTVKIAEKEIRMSEEELAKGAQVEAVWKFKGSYSGTEFPTVTASGQVKGQ